MTRTEGSTKILVSGGGIGGLSFAIEAHLKGYEVQVVERRDSFESFSDIVIIQLPALHTPKTWPGFKKRFDEIAMMPAMKWWRKDGTPIAETTLALKKGESSVAIIRAEFHLLLRDYAVELGVPISYSTHVKEYFENENSAGLVLADGRRVTADVVVAADGWNSHSRELVPSQADAQPKSSRCSILRSAFPVERALENPTIDDFFEGTDETHLVFGNNLHCVLGRSKRVAYWMLTYSVTDEEFGLRYTNEENLQRASDLVKDWCPLVQELVGTSKPEEVLDWPLVWRDPRPDWSTPGGRIIQIGDAARPYLPTSGSGATMAMEDAFTLATILDLGGPAGISLAGKIYNKLRFERATAVQLFGFRRRQLFHKTDWNTVKMDKNRKSPAIPYWIMNHNPAKYALERYEEARAAVVDNKPLKATNSVPGYTYRPWTVQELMDAQDRGEVIHNDGEWGDS